MESKYALEYVLLDWRPYDLPEVYGIFESELDAIEFALESLQLELDEDGELPDGVIVRVLIDKDY